MEKIWDKYSTIDFEDFSVRTTNCLKKNNIVTYGQLFQCSYETLMSWENFGVKCLNEVQAFILENKGKTSFEEGVITDATWISHFPFFSGKKANKELEAKILEKIAMSINYLGMDFSVRAISSFENFKIKTLGDLLLICSHEYLNVRHVGKTTYDEVSQKIKTIFERNNDILKDFNSNAKKNTNEDVFPFFRGTPYSVKIQDLKDVKTGEMNISVLEVGKKIITKLNKIDIYSFQDLLNTQVIQFSNKLRDEELNVIFTKAYQLAKALLIEKECFCNDIDDCCEYVGTVVCKEGFLQAYLNPREEKCLRLRLGIDSEVKTLQEIANQEKITRERVRQLENKALNKLNLKLKTSCRLAISRFIDEYHRNGQMLMSEYKLGQYNNNGLKILKALLKVRGEKIEYIEEIAVWKFKDQNRENKIDRYLRERCREGDFYSEIEMRDLIVTLGKVFDIGKVSIKPLSAWVMLKWFKKERDKYFFRTVNRSVLMEYIFKKYFPDGLAVLKDYNKLVVALKKERVEHFFKIKKGYFQNLLLLNDNIVLWAWGVYIHKDCVKIDDKVLKSVKDWIAHKFIKEKVPKVSLWGAYEKYRSECVKSGIPNEHALYTCMKMFFSEEYSFLKDPYVYPAGTDEMLKAKDYIEKHLLEIRKALSAKEIGALLGIRPYQTTNILSYSDKILQWGIGKYIHIRNINVSMSDLEAVCDYAKKMTNKYKHFSIKQIFHNNIVLCKKNKIETPRALFSLFNLYFSDQLFFPRYPYVLCHDHGIHDDGVFSLNDLVEDFFFCNNRVVHLKELYDYFVVKRGYNKASIETINYLCEGIVKYSRGSFINLKAIKWSEEKSKKLEDIAIQEFQKNVDLGKPFGVLLDVLERELPEINEEIEVYWQRTLLRELLESIDSIKFIGSYKDIYILYPNKYNLLNTEDLIAFVLKNEFGGAVNKGIFLKRLKELGIVATLPVSAESAVLPYKINNEEVFLINKKR